MKKVYVLFLLVLGSLGIRAQFNINAPATNYTQDFNTLTSGTWTDNTLLAGWYARTDLTATIASYGANTGTTTAAGLYAFGVAGTNPLTDRALGYVASNAFTGAAGTGKGYIGWRLKNNTGGPISSITVTWTGEQWRKENNAAAHSLNLFYQVGTTVTSLTTGTWTSAPSTFTSPIIGATTATALDGNAPANRTANISVTITVAIPAGDEIMLRWEDLNDSGNDHFLAIDDITINATAGSSSTPDIALSSPNPAVTAGNISQGTTNNVIYRFDLAVTTANATVNGVTINTAGTYTVTDITNLKCWYSADNTFNAGSDVLLSTKTTSLGTGTHVFPSFTNQTILNGATGYFFITTDIPCLAVAGNTISVNAITTADISVVSGNKTGSAFAGDAQTIISATPSDVTSPSASVANSSSVLTWTNPAGCYDEVLIVARANTNNDGVPTGDGTAYTANLNYGSGTALGNGFVVYKGNTSPQTVTGLTNGTAYYYKFFTRLGTTWSSGIEVNATPALVTVNTDYFRSVASGDWATLTTWESSSDSTNWIPATLVPGASAAHVVIQNPDSVYINTGRTTINLTIMSGAKFNALSNTLILTDRFNLLGTSSFYQGGTGTIVPGVVRILNPTSNYHYNGTQAGTNAGAYPEYGNLYWEPAPTGGGTFQNNVAAAPFNLGLVIRGNMTINLQSASQQEIRFASSTSITRSHTIDGDLNIVSANSKVVITNGGLPVHSTLTVGGDINISAGVLQGTSTNPTNDGNATLNLKGDINNTGGVIQTGLSTAGLFYINYIGTSAQSINNTGGSFIFSANQRDTINNTDAVGVTLNTPITHSGNIHFNDGYINTTATNLLTMGAGSSVTGASNASYVFGPMKKIGNTDFIFPVGKANGLVPLGVSGFTGASAPTDEFIAEYIRSSAAALGAVTPPLTRVSSCEYWNLVASNGTPSVLLTLYWNANNSCGGPYITDLASLEIAQFGGTNWDNSSFGFSSKNGNTTAGDITWTNAISSFGFFTLGSTSGSNPLPITINYFNGTRSNGNHLLNWKVTCISTSSATIDLERSSDGRNYSSIYSIFATALRCEQPFDYTDANPAKGVNYYRLKMTDVDGKITYSSIVTLINASKGIDIMNIAPNPIVNGAFNLKVSSADKAAMEVVIIDMQGRVMMKQSSNMIAGFNVIPMNVKQLAPGTYQLFGNTTDGRTRVLRFVVQ